MPKFELTTADRQVIEYLRDEASAWKSYESFGEYFLPFSVSKFHKILDVLDDKKGSSYFDEIKDKEGLLQDLREIAENLPAWKLEREKRMKIVIYPVTQFRAVAQAVRECDKKGDNTPERIVKFIGPTGSGKTSLRNYLLKEFRTELSPAYVEARDAWRPLCYEYRLRAALVALLDIAKGLGLRISDEKRRKGLSAIEDAIIDACIATRRLLFIDEAEFFTPYLLNFIKLLLNKSRLVIVIACTPRAHAKWNQYYTDEAEQIARRTHATVIVGPISPKDAALFFPAAQFEEGTLENGDEKTTIRAECLKIICDEAARFGHYSTIARIAEKLKKHKTAGVKDVETIADKAMVDMAKSLRKK